MTGSATANSQVSSQKVNTKPQQFDKKAYTTSGKPFLLFSTLPYYSLHVLYFLAYYTVSHYQNPYIVLTLLFVVIPFLDFFFEDWLNPTKEQNKELGDSILFQIPLYSLVVIDNVFVIWLIHYSATHSLPFVFYPGAVYLASTFAGANFLVAHELFHRRGLINRIIAPLTIAKNLYMHYVIEHTYGHHKTVATPEDPTTARYGETMFQYLPRTISMGFMSAWKIEKRKLLKKGYKSIWVPQNRMLWFILADILIPTFVFMTLGLKGLLIYLPTVLNAVVVLEAAQYVEHYGLLRKEIAPGEYEKVNITHSWNAPQRFSNYMLLKVQRHSDHHENAHKPYQALASYDESPTLPFGYLFSQVLTFFPPVWLKIMDKMMAANKEKRELTEEEKNWIHKQGYAVITQVGAIIIGLGILTWYYTK